MSSKFHLGWFILVAFGILAFFAIISEAKAGQCGSAKQAEEVIKKYGESDVFIGVNKRGVVVRITLNPKTGTWSAFGYMPDGRRVCIADAGENGMPAKPKAPKKPAKGDPA